MKGIILSSGSKIIRKILRITNIGYFLHIFLGLKTYKKINDDSKKIFIITSHGIGDVVWLCAFIKDFKKINKIDSLTLVIEDKLKSVVELYEGYDGLICVSREELINLEIYSSSKFNKNDNLKVGIYPIIKSRRKMLYDFKILSEMGLDMDLVYKYGCLNLPYNAKCQLPKKYLSNSSYVEFYTNKYNIVKDKSIVLVPYVNSRHSISKNVWKEIGEYFTKKGFKVYTNTKDDKEKPIQGTINLSVPIHILPGIIDYCGLAISGRCGLGDWLFLSQCNLIILHSIKNKCSCNHDVSLNNITKKESFLEMKHRCNFEENNNYLMEYVLKNTNGVVSNLDELLNDIEKDLLPFYTGNNNVNYEKLGGIK